MTDELHGIRHQLRRLFPAHGRAYELFDCSVLLLVLAGVGYVYTDPTAVAREALTVPFSVDGQSTT